MSDLLLTPMPDGRTWKLARDYVVWWRSKKIVVPKGFVTDLASVPRLFWRVFPPFGKYTVAATVHDWLYRSRQFSRKDADRCFLDLMTNFQVPTLARHVLYLAVRCFGWLAWMTRRQND